MNKKYIRHWVRVSPEAQELLRQQAKNEVRSVPSLMTAIIEQWHRDQLDDQPKQQEQHHAT